MFGGNFYIVRPKNTVPFWRAFENRLSITMAESGGKRRRIDDSPIIAEKPYVIERISERKARKYNIEEITFRAKFNTDLRGRQLLDVTDELHDLFQEVLDNVSSEHGDPNDRARLSIRHSGLDREIFIHCQPQHNITPDVIMERYVCILFFPFFYFYVKCYILITLLFF